MATDVIGEFVRALRAAEIPVSTSETLDAMRAAELLGYSDRAKLRAGLSSALAKTEAHRRVFDTCFDRFFTMPDTSTESPEHEQDQPSPQSLPGSLLQRMLGGGQEGASGDGSGTASGDSLGELAQQLLNQDEAAVAAAMASAGQETGAANIRVITQKGLVGRRIYLAMGGEQLDQDIRDLEETGRGDAQRLANGLRQGRDQLRGSIRQYVARQFLLQGGAERTRLREQTMREVALRDLREFRDVSEVIRRMARKLIALHSRRQKRSRKGLLDARRTVVASIATDTVPWRTYWRQRRRIKPRLFVVCDVSNSVSAASGLLMMFLAAVSEVLPRTRTFVFASRFSEVSDQLQGPVDQSAIECIMEEWAGPGTDYAGMFEDFLATAGSDINKRSTVIFLGDARNNDMPARPELLKEIAQRAGAVMWLNPESRSRWNSGDSVMAAYQPACRQVASCTTLAELERFVSLLLKDMRRL